MRHMTFCCSKQLNFTFLLSSLTWPWPNFSWSYPTSQLNKTKTTSSSRFFLVCATSLQSSLLSWVLHNSVCRPLLTWHSALQWSRNVALWVSRVSGSWWHWVLHIDWSVLTAGLRSWRTTRRNSRHTLITSSKYAQLVFTSARRHHCSLYLLQCARTALGPFEEDCKCFLCRYQSLERVEKYWSTWQTLPATVKANAHHVEPPRPAGESGFLRGNTSKSFANTT